MSLLDGLFSEATRSGSSEDSKDTPKVSLSFKVKKFVLLPILEKASIVVPQKDILPVLKNFHVTVTPDRIRVVTTDLELSMVLSSTMVTPGVSGIAVFPASRMLEIVRASDDGDITVEVVKNTAKITAGRSSWDLKLQSGRDFPPLPDVQSVQFTNVDRKWLLYGLQTVRYAIAKDSSRPSLMMIYLSDGKMTACDGGRFQQAALGEKLLTSIQIPAGAVDDLIKLLRVSDTESVLVGETSSHLIFHIHGHELLLTNKVMAKFPDVEQLLLRPALSNTDLLTVSRAGLVEALKRVRINADPETSAIGLALSPGKVTVTSRDRSDNGASVEVDAEWKTGERTLTVNHHFLMEMLSAYSGDVCNFYLGEDTKSRKSPLLLKDPEAGTVGIIQQMLASHLRWGA